MVLVLKIQKTTLMAPLFYHEIATLTMKKTTPMELLCIGQDKQFCV